MQLSGVYHCSRRRIFKVVFCTVYHVICLHICLDSVDSVGHTKTLKTPLVYFHIFAARRCYQFHLFGHYLYIKPRPDFGDKFSAFLGIIDNIFLCLILHCVCQRASCMLKHSLSCLKDKTRRYHYFCAIARTSVIQ